MKRIIALLVTLSLALAVVGAQAVSLADVVGRWYFTTVNGQGINGDSYIEFNRDRSVTLVLNGTNASVNYTWSLDGEEVVVKESDSIFSKMRFQVADGGLTISTTELGELVHTTGIGSFYNDFVLAREKASYYTPAAVTAASEEEFFGTFIPYLMVMNGNYTTMFSNVNSIAISMYVAVLTSEDAEGTQELLTNFADGRLIIYEEDQEVEVFRTSDPDVLILKGTSSGTPAEIYVRREGAAPAAENAVAPTVENTEEPAFEPITAEVPALDTATIEVPAVDAPATQTAPVFPGMISQPAAATPAVSAEEAFYGQYVVYQDMMSDGRVLDMTAYGITAEISAAGVRAVAYGKEVNVPYAYENGQMTADLGALYPAYAFATATLGDNGELTVTLSDAAGTVGETLSLRRQ